MSKPEFPGLLKDPRPATVAAAAALLAIADFGSERAGGSLVPGGPLDESAHLLTTLLVIWAVLGRTPRRFKTAALASSVLIDLDHVPDRLGFDFLTAGTPRPYTHSLSTIVLILIAAVLWRRRRAVLLGVAVGVAIHFWRDLSDPGTRVALLWPASNTGSSVPHASYVAGMGLVAAVAAMRPLSRPALLPAAR